MLRAATAAVLMGHSRVAPDGAAAYGGDKYPIRAAVFKILERPRSSPAAMTLFAVVVMAIVASTITWALSTVEGMEDNMGIMVVEIIANVVFTFELTLRLYAMQAELKSLVTDPGFYVDVFSLLPFYVQCGVWISNADSVPEWAKLLRLLGVLRVLKLLRHYSGWRVLIIAVKRSSRPIFVPMFAILVATLILGGILQKLEPETFPDVFDSMYAIFWLLLTLGYDGDLGSSMLTGHGVRFESRFLIAAALICGVILTTMPITIIGNAFAAAWEKKEVIEVAMDVQEFLQERGLKPRDVENVFKEFDPDGSGTLDWDEFHGAMQVLNSKLPFNQMKRLFGLFDGDGNGRVDQAEFCSLIFPGMQFGQEGPPHREVDGSPIRNGNGSSPGRRAASPTGGGIGNNDLLTLARKKAEDARENKELPVGDQIKELRRMQADTQKIVEELAAGMKLIHRHLELGPYSSNPPPQARPESPA